MLRVLVTGGAGFIGSHLVDRLLDEGHHVTVLDDFSMGSPENLGDSSMNPRLRVMRADIRDESVVDSVTKGIDVVYHLAAFVGVPQSLADPYKFRQTNVNGTINLLRSVHANGVSLFVFASTAAVYGNSKAPQSEETPPNPLSPYAETKLEAEQHCSQYFEEYGLNTVVFRLFNVYGRRQNDGPYASVISKFLRSYLRGEPLTVEGDGKQSRDFIQVKDVLEPFFAVPERKELGGQVFNIGSGTPTTVNELVEIVRKLADGKILVKYTKAREGDIRHSFADISRARRLLGFSPKSGLREGLNSLYTN